MVCTCKNCCSMEGLRPDEGLTSASCHACDLAAQSMRRRLPGRVGTALRRDPGRRQAPPGRWLRRVPLHRSICPVGPLWSFMGVLLLHQDGSLVGLFTKINC